MPQKGRIVAKISLPETPWVLKETMEPLHTNGLDPLRRILNAAGVKVERRTDPEHEGRIQPMKVAVHKPLLLGRADAHPDNAGFDSANTGDQRFFLRFVQITKRRCEDAHNSCPRKTACEAITKLLSDAFFTAIQKVRVTGKLSPAEDLKHEIGTGN